VKAQLFDSLEHVNLVLIFQPLLDTAHRHKQTALTHSVPAHMHTQQQQINVNTYGRRAFSDGLELTPGFYPGSNEQHRLF